MPVQVSYPGVYIQEVSSGVHTITGVSTSIAAFFGRTAKGPINKAVRCLSMSDFTRNFGGAHPRSDLGQSVRMFFINGGTDCYVVRLAAGAQPACITLRNLIGTVSLNVLNVTAKTPGIWGNGLRLEVDYKTANADETFNLTIIQLENGKEVAREMFSGLSMDPKSPRFAPDYVTQSSALVDVKIHDDVRPASPLGPAGADDISNPAKYEPGYGQSRAFKTDPLADLDSFRTEFESILTKYPNLVISVDEQPPANIDLSTVLTTVATAAPPAILGGSAWTLANMAGRLESVINAQLPPGTSVKCIWRSNGDPLTSINLEANSPNALRITANSGLKRSVRVSRAADKDFAAQMMMGVSQGGIEVTGHSQFRPIPTGAYYNDPEELIDLFGLTRDQINWIQIDNDPPISLTGLFDSISPDSLSLWFKQNGVGVDGVREKLNIIVKTVNATTTSKWKADLWGYHLVFIAKDKNATFNLKPSGVLSTPDGLTGSLSVSKFVLNTKQYSLGRTGDSPYQRATVADDEGLDGSAPGLTEFKGIEEKKTGFYALDIVDLFNLMVIPADDEIGESAHQTIWSHASTYCRNHRAFLLIDSPPGWTKNGLVDLDKITNQLPDIRLVEKDFSAVFYPRLLYMNDAGLKKSIGSAGSIAGLMARIDSTRGVWKAPAGIEANMRGIVGLEVRLTDMENGVLNKQAVNCHRAFPSGIVNWGARTVDGFDDNTTEWKYIPVRRLALFLEESLYRGSKWIVFEPNDEKLWAQIRLNFGAFMNNLFRQGAFQGMTSREAYFVKCDKETTTQNDIDLGIVNILVGFAPLKPAEFVVISIQQIAGQIQI